MAASDDLSKLGARAKEAEDRVVAAREKAKADVEADLDYARGAGEEEAKALQAMVDDRKDRGSERWAAVQKTWSEAVAGMRAEIESHKAEHDLHRARRRADRAEEDARFALDFAYSAIAEAEYTALDAVLARKEAEELAEQAGAAA